MSELVKDREQFQYWLSHMDEALAEFLEALPAADRKRLDGTPESLDHLEALLLAKYASPAEARRPSEAKFLDGAARYFGEILRKGSGSVWKIELDDKTSVFHALPILFGGQIKSVAICPLTSMTALLDRRTGKFLSNTCVRLSAPGR